jgi:hypothetical protein
MKLLAFILAALLATTGVIGTETSWSDAEASIVPSTTVDLPNESVTNSGDQRAILLEHDAIESMTEPDQEQEVLAHSQNNEEIEKTVAEALRVIKPQLEIIKEDMRKEMEGHTAAMDKAMGPELSRHFRQRLVGQMAQGFSTSMLENAGMEGEWKSEVSRMVRGDGKECEEAGFGESGYFKRE